ncbi:MAG: YqgE/AlgH family protein [Hyphomicrobiaceae bacterium]|nr:YqgE/AlgH family protein [Hyphomicrobiaceae bacterium]
MMGSDGYLEGQLLVAMPLMSDKRFAKSVIYMLAHSNEGAMGLIINQQAPNISFPELMKQLSLAPQPDEEEAFDGSEIRVHLGGPVDTQRGFVLHTPDYCSQDSTLTIDASVSLTATVDILKAMAGGRGPDRAILALGYSGWSAGQLESEIHANGWLHCPADPDIVFHPELETKYERAMSRIGIDPSHLVSQAGHA